MVADALSLFICRFFQVHFAFGEAVMGFSVGRLALGCTTVLLPADQPEFWQERNPTQGLPPKLQAFVLFSLNCLCNFIVFLSSIHSIGMYWVSRCQVEPVDGDCAKVVRVLCAPYFWLTPNLLEVLGYRHRLFCCMRPSPNMPSQAAGMPRRCLKGGLTVDFRRYILTRS